MVLRRLPLVAATLALTVLAGVVALLGGWGATDPDGPETVAPGTEVAAAPFRVRLDSAVAAYEAGGRSADPGQAFLVVSGSLRLDADQPASSTTLGDALAAELPHAFDEYGDPAVDPSPRVAVAADGSSLLGIGPGLTYAVDLVFTVAEADVPRRLAVVVDEHERRDSLIDGEPGWFDPTPVARVQLDVAPLPAVRPEPEGLS